MYAKCSACVVNLKVKYSDLIKHANSNKHKNVVKKLKSSKQVDLMLKHNLGKDQEHIDVVCANLRSALLVAEHNLSFNVIDHITKINKVNFQDSKTQVLGLEEVDCDHGTAKGLYVLLKQSLTEFNIEAKNVVGYCADNASVMIGSKESVKHPKRQSVLETLQEYMRNDKLRILKPSATRWLALSKCVDRILEMWDVLTELFRLADFERESEVAKIIYNELCNPITKAYMLRLRKKRAKYQSESELVKGEKHAICEIIHNFHVTEKRAPTVKRKKSNV
ncbi:hypothetical protein NQ314_008050 [Rhamnusium bicolor]|uniref:DUF4371 domain-containing protein n=1 Tax=Rhamnusium bicolor TaxID=1586634 RepID=A0AAV8YHN8_9CUCU|nr:hypothetical protein NQ314_008050 [Rhamnusium bicolor]